MTKNLFSREDVKVIAELGINHEGDIKVAEIVRTASGSGASAIKLQSFTPERYASDATLQAERFSLTRSAQTSQKGSSGCLNFISTPLSEDCEPLSELCDALKIARRYRFSPTITVQRQTFLL